MNHRIARFLQTRLINPRIRRSAGRPGNRFALLETAGRKTGLRRQTPVGDGLEGDGLEGDVFRIFSEQGRDAFYVKHGATPFFLLGFLWEFLA